MSRPTCRYCGRRIIWAVTERGKRIPLDLNPNPEVNIALSEPNPGWPFARVLRKDEQPAAREARYMPHYATCPSFNRQGGDGQALPP